MEQQTDNVLISLKTWEKTVAALDTCRMALEIITKAIDSTAQSKEALIAKEALDMPVYIESKRDMEHIKQSWNNSADEYNQWDNLSADEQLDAAINALAYKGK